LPPKITNTPKIGVGGGKGKRERRGEEGVKDEPYDNDGFHLKVPVG
jgi:hypothetical protein